MVLAVKYVTGDVINTKSLEPVSRQMIPAKYVFHRTARTLSSQGVLALQEHAESESVAVKLSSAELFDHLPNRRACF